MPELPDPVFLAIPGFVAFMLLELLVRHLRGKLAYQTMDTAASLVMGVGSVAEGLVLGFVKYGVLLLRYVGSTAHRTGAVGCGPPTWFTTAVSTTIL